MKKLLIYIAVIIMMTFFGNAAFAEEKPQDIQDTVADSSCCDISGENTDTAYTDEKISEEDNASDADEDSMLDGGEVCFEEISVFPEQSAEDETDHPEGCESEDDKNINSTCNENREILSEEENNEIVSVESTSSYKVVFESTDGKQFKIDGGNSIDIKEIILGLYGEIPDGEITVDKESIDNTCYKIDNNIYSDYGPFSEAKKNLIVYIGNQKYEVSVRDPISSLSNLTETGTGTSSNPYTYELTGDTYLEGTLIFTQRTSGSEITYYKLNLNNFTLLRDNSTASPFTGKLIEVQQFASVSIVNGRISGNGVADCESAITVNNGELNLNSITIENCSAGSTGGAVYINKASVSFDECRIEECSASGSSSAFYIYDSNINMNNTTVRNCTGGSILNVGGNSTLTITSCTISDNISDDSSIVDISSIDGDKIVVNINGTNSSKTVISGNKAIASGNQGTSGALHIYGNVDCTIENTDIVNNTGSSCGGITAVASTAYNPVIKINESNVSNNKSSGSGGGFLLSVDATEFSVQGAELYIENSSICGNTADDYGGAIWAVDADITLNKGTIISNNSAKNGGAIDLSYATLIISGGLDNRVIISNNKATESNGGGIESYYSTIKMNACAMDNNSAADKGGAIMTFDSTLEITDTTLANNIAYEGGGMYLDLYSYNDKKSTIKDTDIYGNTAETCGGGLYICCGIAELTNVEVYGNSANELYGGGIFALNNQTTLKNTKVTNNNANLDGAGIFVEYDPNSIRTSVTQVEENTVVYDNSKNGVQNNIFLTSGTTLNLKNLSKNAKIGVSTEEIAVYEAPVTISAGETESYEYAFVSDSQDFYISNPQSEGKYLIKLCAYKTESPAAYISLLKDEDEEEEDEEETEDAEESEEEETVAIANNDLNPGNPDSDELEKAKAERKAKIVKTVWFTINLLATIITVAISALTFVGKNKSSNMGLKLLSLIPAISLILMLVLSYPYGGTDTVADGYTLVFVVTTAIQCGIGYMAYKNATIFKTDK